MVYPTFFQNIDTGVVSQLSAFVWIAFAYVLNKWKKVLVGSLIIIASIFTITSVSSAAGLVPGACGTMCHANMNYYGQTYGGNPFYPYQSTRFHSFYGPTPYYYQSYGPSPYRPMGMNDCPYCNINYSPYTPGFPSMPGGGMPLTKTKNRPIEFAKR